MLLKGPGMYKHTNSHIHKHMHGGTHIKKCVGNVCKIYRIYMPEAMYFDRYSQTHAHGHAFWVILLRRGLKIITDKTSLSGDYHCDLQ